MGGEKSYQSQIPREHLVKGFRHGDQTQQNFGIAENEEWKPSFDIWLCYKLSTKENLEVRSIHIILHIQCGCLNESGHSS